MSDETAKRRANREQRRQKRPAQSASTTPNAKNDGGRRSSKAEEGSFGDLATDLLKRAASPTVLGAAAGAAAAARLTAKPKEKPSGDARRAEKPTPRRERAEEDAETPGGRRDEGDEEQIVLEGPERSEEPLQASLATSTPAGRERDQDERDRESGERQAALGESEQGGAIRQALQYARELTGRDIDGVSAVERHDQGVRVTVEVVELKRIPSSTDVLASYELTLDGDGDLIDYRRARRYYRNSTTEERFA